MSHLFGEIVQPVSRAFWLDDEEEFDEIHEQESEFTIEWLQQEPVSLEKLIIVEGDLVVDCIKKCVIHNAKEICAIKHKSAKKSSFIYEVDSSLYVCIVSSCVDLTDAGDFIESIEAILLKAKKMISLTNLHVSQLKTDEDRGAPSFLKTLRTKEARDTWKVHAPHLKQPNIISGIAAGALSFAETKGTHGVLFVLYTDCFMLDSKSAQPLVALLSEITNRTLPDFSSIKSGYFVKGNLYL